MKNRFISKRLGVFCIVTSCLITNANALVKEVELPLFSYHIDNNATYKLAPNKLDSNAVFVANPGLLLGLDSRKDTKTDGFSFLAKGGFFQDCANKTLFALGGGGRYRYFLSKNISLDANGYLMAANAVTSFGDGKCYYDPSTGDFTNCQINSSGLKRSTVVLPLLNLGINYHLKSNKSLGFTVSYVPQNITVAATSGTDILFFTVNMGL